MSITTSNHSKKYYEYANDSYKSFTPDFLESAKLDLYIEENNESLLKFLESYQEQFGSFSLDKTILETGCGLGGISHYFSKKGYYTLGLDQSSLAISMAKDIAKNKKLYAKFKQQDLCINKAQDKFDIIIDSHLLHCLVDNTDRHNYLSFVKESLSKGGLFFLETMSYHSKIQAPLGYELREDMSLYKETNSIMLPYRKIIESLNLEQELIEIGFKIKYLYYHNELCFSIFDEYPSFSFEHLPKTIRLVATI